MRTEGVGTVVEEARTALCSTEKWMRREEVVVGMGWTLTRMRKVAEVVGVGWSQTRMGKVGVVEMGWTQMREGAEVGMDSSQTRMRGMGKWSWMTHSRLKHHHTAPQQCSISFDAQL